MTDLDIVREDGGRVAGVEVVVHEGHQDGEVGTEVEVDVLRHQ